MTYPSPAMTDTEAESIAFFAEHEKMVKQIIIRCLATANRPLGKEFDEAVRISFDAQVLDKGKRSGYSFEEIVDHCVAKTKTALPHLFSAQV